MASLWQAWTRGEELQRQQQPQGHAADPLPHFHADRRSAVCCCTLSIFAIIVLVGMGFLVQAGDPYIGGHKLDREKRANACFGAAGCYAVTLALSGVCWIRGKRQAKAEALME
ncbi:hypothetical protein T484DRAFT_1803066 [Baffinella frigidus]|nr:hypothetical protein T484DRAFT_1803066 [Cryptophyta sp. CCMP2293]